MQTTKTRINPMIEIIPEEEEMAFILESELLGGEIDAWESYRINMEKIKQLKI